MSPASQQIKTKNADDLYLGDQYHNDQYHNDQHHIGLHPDDQYRNALIFSVGQTRPNSATIAKTSSKPWGPSENRMCKPPHRAQIAPPPPRCTGHKPARTTTPYASSLWPKPDLTSYNTAFGALSADACPLRPRAVVERCISPVRVQATYPVGC